MGSTTTADIPATVVSRHRPAEAAYTSTSRCRVRAIVRPVPPELAPLVPGFAVKFHFIATGVPSHTHTSGLAKGTTPAGSCRIGILTTGSNAAGFKVCSYGRGDIVPPG